MKCEKSLKSKRFKKAFTVLGGEKVKTAPKGFKKDNTAIDLLRYKQYLLHRNIPDEVVLSENFMDEVLHYYGGNETIF